MASPVAKLSSRASKDVCFNEMIMSRTISSKTVLGATLMAVALFFGACDSAVDGVSDGKGLSGYYESTADSRGSLSDSQGSGRQDSAATGVVTAGEWNDLDHWYFWRNLMATQNDSTKYYSYPPYWHYNTANRIGLKLTGSDGRALVNAQVQLRRGDSLLWSTRSDNLGRAELWLGLNDQEPAAPALEQCALYVNELPVAAALQKDTLNEVPLPFLVPSSNRVELAFVVDATGSMGDEMYFLKNDLTDVVSRVMTANASLQIFTAAVFYRDEGDTYVVKHQEFTDDLDKTVKYIRAQSADGGGDYPEAVHTALKTTWTELQWSGAARTRIAFLLLDAPPHYDEQIIADIHHSVREFASRGIKVIPIAASGIDKPTEFLLRYLAMATNGTYVFLTDDSGVGLPHLTPSVGEYQVEHLNDLLVRLIGKYSE